MMKLDLDVGLPVVAKDPNDDTLGYHMLSGADAGSFQIDHLGTGRITVKARCQAGPRE